MAISIVSHSTATGSSSTAIIPKPADVQNGDVLVAHISNTGTHNSTPPDGWVEKYDNEDEGDEAQIALSYKVITNAGGEPANYTFTFAGSAPWCGAITCLRGVDAADPWEVHARNSDEDDDPEAPSVVAARNNSMLLCFVTMADTQTFTPPFGTEERYDFGNAGWVSCTMAYLEVDAGATGSKGFDASSMDWWSAIAVVLNPLSVGIARPLVGGSLASSGLVGKGLAR